jgi:hypothetical protein
MNPPYGSNLFSSGSLVLLAKDAAERSRVKEPEAQVAVILACAATECAFNDLFTVVATWEEEPSAKVRMLLDVLSAVEDAKENLLSKLKLVHLVSTGRQLDIGRQPFQDFHELYKLRSALIHRRPDPLIPLTQEPDRNRYRRTVEFVLSRGLGTIYIGDPAHPQLSNVAQGYALAKWAVNTAITVAIEMADMFYPLTDLDTREFIHGFRPIE